MNTFNVNYEKAESLIMRHLRVNCGFSNHNFTTFFIPFPPHLADESILVNNLVMNLEYLRELMDSSTQLMSSEDT